MAFSDLGTYGTGLGALTSLAGGIYGAVTGSKDAQDIANIQQQMAQTQIQENDLRRTAMETMTRRQQMQNIRQTQMARSMALTTASSQGGQFGSGLQGAFGSIAGQSNTNQANLIGNLAMGEKMFDLSNTMSSEEMMLSQAQAGAASDAAFGKLLGGIGSSMGDLGKIGSSFGGLFKSFGF